jgi:hypothetical protein
MKRKLIRCAMAACLAASPTLYASDTHDAARGQLAAELSPTSTTVVAKAASTRTLGSRATVTPSITMYGGFELAAPATVYILVRGNSLGTLGITQGFLDRPRVRIYNAAGQDLVTDNAGRPGFNFCTASTDQEVINFYNNRGQPASANDACIAADFSAGAFTFTVTPSTAGGITSSPSSGEVLFEVTLGP